MGGNGREVGSTRHFKFGRRCAFLRTLEATTEADRKSRECTDE
jgi:hypothetical protein